MDGWCENVPCYSWDDFVNKVHKLPQNKFFYRGQSDDKQPLRSSFDRAVDASQSLVRERWQYEAAILREFKRRAHHYILDAPAKNDLLEWLSLMRHHGAPTRLVDFTYSHYIASYFAFCELTCEPRVVWAINKDWLSEKSRERCRIILKGPSNVQVDLHDPETFIKCFLALDNKSGTSHCFVADLNAERMNTRLTVQQGFFLCSGNIERTFDENLKGLDSKESCQKHIIKFVIPHCARNDALRELRHMNISKATLFPDLGGLAASLNDRFEQLFKDYNIPEQTLKRVYEF